LPNRYFIKLSFKGTHYHGWQVQLNSTTVQGILNRDLSIILGKKIETTGAGRTDTGVHAKVFYAHFDSERDNLHQDPNLIFKINGKLPKDIAIHEILKVKDDAHARYNAISRTYEYHITRIKDPFLTDLAHYIYGELDFEAMKSATALLLNVSDFTSFSKVDTDVKTNICKISRADWEIDKEKIVFTITADRFLRDMVRAIMGTMLDIGFGRIKPEDLTVIINKKDRSAAGASVPAKGLFLVDVQYPGNIFI
jgi:tRNA pseudouridine38-40 synthase